MAHLRLFQPHRRTQSLRFPDFAIGDLRRIRIIAARARRGRFTAPLRTLSAIDGAGSPCPEAVTRAALRLRPELRLKQPAKLLRLFRDLTQSGPRLTQTAHQRGIPTLSSPSAMRSRKLARYSSPALTCAIVMSGKVRAKLAKLHRACSLWPASS